MARLGVAASLCSIVGDDEAGRALVTHLRAAGVDTAGVRVAANLSTPEYAAILAPTGELYVGAAETSAISALTIDDLERRPEIESAAWLFIDCNLPQATIAACVARSRSSPRRLAVDAVSVAKAQRLPSDLTGVDLLFLNEAEALACGGRDAIARRGVAEIVISCGPRGVLVEHRTIPAPDAKLVDVTGAGDALVAGTLYGLLAGEPFEASVSLGMRLAALAVETTASVRQDLTPAMLTSLPRRSLS